MATKYIVDNLTGQTINGQQVQPYKVFTAFLSQSGESDIIGINTGLLTIGITYFINDTQAGMDFTNVGAPNNNVGTYFIATGEDPNSWGIDEGLGVLVYDTGVPVATVLENTIGNIWFTGSSPGFSVNSDNLFNQPFLNTFNWYNNGNDTVSILTANIDDMTSSYIGYNRFDLQGIPTSVANLPFEIRVYN